jgi:hypothetical protein
MLEKMVSLSPFQMRLSRVEKLPNLAVFASKVVLWLQLGLQANLKKGIIADCTTMQYGGCCSRTAQCFGLLLGCCQGHG